MIPYGERIKAIKGLSFNALKGLDETFDVIYIDGSHLSKHVLEDAVLSLPLLNPGGLLIFDDYGWNGYEESHKLPKHAIDAFVSCNRDKLTLLHLGWQVILKNGNS
jgi:predicted O-methyltransferase YrrM